MKRYIIPIFIPHYGCRYTCVFCNQHTITSAIEPVTGKKVQEIIEMHLERIDRPRSIEVAFYGGSFTAIVVEKQREFLQAVASYLKQNKIGSIRVSTRPDYVNEDILDLLIEFGVTTIELGVQSFDDNVLRLAKRGHTAADVVAAVGKIKRRSLQLGIQLMPGLPGESWQSLMKSTLKAIEQQPTFVRIYPAVVLRGTEMATMYNEGRYEPLSLEKAVAYSAWMKAWFEEHGICVIRTGLQATEALDDEETILAGPYHPAFGEMVDARNFYCRVARLLEVLRPIGREICIYHHPADASKVRGNKNENTLRLIDKYRPKQIVFKQDATLQRQQLRVVVDGQIFFIQPVCKK